MNAARLLSNVAFATGTLLTLTALWFLIRENSGRRFTAQQVDRPAGGGFRVPTAAALAAVGLALVSVALGLNDIERWGMTHVEAYVPGLNLPADISTPPPRLDLPSTLSFHLQYEPHPPGYFLLMLAWTKLFGTSLTAIRLPSVLCGGAAVLLIFGLGTTVGRSAWVGLVAAALLAFNGHNLFWMGRARMYELALLLSLASIWLWYELVSGRWRRWKEWAYVGTTVLGLYCHTLIWPVLTLQALFTLTRRVQADGRPSRPYTLQILCVILGAPMLAHAVYVGQDVQSGGPPTLAFLQDYLNFGFLFTPDRAALTPRDILPQAEVLLTAAALLCAWLFMKTPRFRPECRTESLPPLSYRHLMVLSVGMAFLVLGAAVMGEHRNLGVGLMAVVPIMAAAHLLVLERLPQIGRLLGAAKPDSAIWNPMVAVGLGSFALVFAIAFFKGIAVSRALLVSVPPLLVMLAAGLVECVRQRRLLGATLAVFVLGMHLWSVAYFHEYSFANDYRGAAEQLQTKLAPADLIFVTRQSWLVTPVFYHLQGEFHRLVASDYAKVTSNPEVRRVWVWGDPAREIRLPTDMSEALMEFAPVDSVRALRAGFTLFQRDGVPRDTIPQSSLPAGENEGLDRGQ